MGGLCCYNANHQALESDASDSIRPLSLLGFIAKTELPFGHLVSLSYQQRRDAKYKNFGVVEPKRILAFSSDRIYIDLLTGRDCIFKNEYILEAESGTIVYGSFVYDNKARYFLTLNDNKNRYFVKTYEFIQTEEDTNNYSRQMIKHLNPSVDNLGASRKNLYVRMFNSYKDIFRFTNFSDSYEIHQVEKIEFKEFQDQTLNCVKVIKSIASGQAELIITSDFMIGTVIISKKSIMLLKSQETYKKVIGIEYWSGYYFLLYENNHMGIYKRNLAAEFEEVKFLKFEIREDVKINQIKIPKLEWSGRFSDILHKEMPTHILLIGTTIIKDNKENYFFKYNIYTNQCDGYNIVSSGTDITAINYGPYDNGPILIGLSDGTITIYDYSSMQLIRRIEKMVKDEVKWIMYELGSAIIIGTVKAVYKCRSL